MKLQILSFEWNKFENEKVQSFTIMTKAWEITVLDNHEALITAIEPWTIEINILEDSEEKTEFFAIWKWVIEISDSKSKIMTNMLLWVWEVDLEQAEQAKAKALELMEKAKADKNKIDMEKYLEAEEQLAKSMAKMKLHELKK